MRCPKCGSYGWDWANIGFSEAKQCEDCGEIYMLKEEPSSTLLQNIYFGGVNPLDSFPTIKGDNK